MRNLPAAPLIFLISACENNAAKRSFDTLQKRTDSLEKIIARSYKPGFGELMLSVQVHHNKLWFAGSNENWELAGFEVNEIMEMIENIKNFEAGRKETVKIDMILQAMDSMNVAIEKKDKIIFTRSFHLLTNTCNNCHNAVDFGFNVVKVPGVSPFPNQDFSKPSK
jgi:hypothetical protein